MKTKLLVSAALAVALGLSSWTAGAAGYGESAATPKAAPATSGTAQSGVDAQEAARQARLSGAVAVAHARRALDALVRAHVIDQRDEAVIENREVEAEQLFGSG